MLGRLLQELRRLLEHVLAVGLVVGRDDVLGRRRRGLAPGASGSAGACGGAVAASTSSSENWRVGWSTSTGGLRRGRRRCLAADCGSGSGSGSRSGSGSLWWIGASRRSSAITSSSVAAVVEVQIVVGSAGSAATGSSTSGGRRVATGGAQRLVLEARHLAGVGAVAPLELEMFPDRVVEQSHGAPNPSDAGRDLQLG